MLRSSALVAFVLVIAPATVHAFDLDHHHHHHSGDHGCSSSSGSDEASSAPAPTPSPSPSPRVVFVTSTTYSGAIGGLQAADAYCQARADAGGLSGTFRAWLSDATVGAYDRIADVGPWYSTGGGVAFAAKASLLGAPQAAIMDEFGQVPASLTAVGGAWSGTDASGAPTGKSCDGWTDATNDAVATMATGAGITWGGGGGVPLSCIASAPILCFAQ